MNIECKGEKCNALNGEGHSIECVSEHESTIARGNGKPIMSELKKVDYSCLVGSQVFVEVSDCGYVWSIANLNESLMKSKYIRICDYEISNANGDLVLPEGVIINCMTRNSDYWERSSSSLINLSHSVSLNDIIAVQVTGAAEGYEL